MITVIIPTLNAADTLPAVLGALVPAAVDGLVTTVVVADGGSGDLTLEIADAAGATIVSAPRGRGSQLRAGAAAARGEWLAFLHGDTVPEPGFEAELAAFCRGTGRYTGLPAERAAAFGFALDDGGLRAELVVLAVRARCALLGLAYGDQGLVIPRAFYDRIGGFSDLPLMEDVDLVRRIGRGRLHVLAAKATTSAERYRRSGYVRRIARNFVCLTLYFLGVPARRIARLYG
jgi:rSAM/selenodomain-associated transferase 2